MLFNIMPLTLQRWPDDAKLLNKEIVDYHLMQAFFGRDDDGAKWECESSTANCIRRWIAAGAPPNDHLQSPSRRRGGGSSKAVADESSDEDFTQRSRQQFKRKPKSYGSSKAIVEENSDDDFM